MNFLFPILLFWGILAQGGCGEPVSLPESPPADPLPSWNAGPARDALLDFVAAISDPSGRGHVPESERIAVFDNDGTLWVEKPAYTQLVFALERVRELADEHPEWRTTMPFQAVLEGDLEALVAGGEHALLEIVMATHAGMSTDEFEEIVSRWIATARDGRFERPFTELVYQPMLEVLQLLRSHGFKTWIVSGGGVEFMRPWVESVYGILPEQVIGSSIKTRYQVDEGIPRLVRLPELFFLDDKEGKPVAIQKFIGRRPIAAFGSSDGDLQMLQWTTSGAGPRLGVIVRHTDGDREYVYDRESSVGRLDRGLDEAPERGWVVIDMARDWNRVFPWQ